MHLSEPPGHFHNSRGCSSPPDFETGTLRQHADNTPIQQRLSKVIMDLGTQMAETVGGALIQAWMPEQCADGSVVLSTQSLPFAIVGVGDLLALFRCVSVRYRFATDNSKPTLMGAIGRVFNSQEPEMSRDVQKYDRKVYLRVTEAQRCRVHSTLVVPVFRSDAPHAPAAVIELIQGDKECPFPAVLSCLRQALQKVHMHLCNFAVATSHELTPPGSISLLDKDVIYEEEDEQTQQDATPLVLLGSRGQPGPGLDAGVARGVGVRGTGPGIQVPEEGVENEPEDGSGSPGSSMPATQLMLVGCEGTPRGSQVAKGLSLGPTSSRAVNTGQADTLLPAWSGVPRAEVPGTRVPEGRRGQHQERIAEAGLQQQPSWQGQGARLHQGALSKQLQPTPCDARSPCAVPDLQQQLMAWLSQNVIDPQALASLKTMLLGNGVPPELGPEAGGDTHRHPATVQPKGARVSSAAVPLVPPHKRHHSRVADPGTDIGTDRSFTRSRSIEVVPTPLSLSSSHQPLQPLLLLLHQSEPPVSSVLEKELLLGADCEGELDAAAAAEEDDLGSSSGADEEGEEDERMGGTGGHRLGNVRVGAGRRLRYEELEAHFGLGLKEAAANLGMCATTLKRACRRHGIKRWPRRQIAKLSRTLTQMGYQGVSSTLLVQSAVKGRLTGGSDKPGTACPVGPVQVQTGVKHEPVIQAWAQAQQQQQQHLQPLTHEQRQRQKQQKQGRKGSPVQHPMQVHQHQQQQQQYQQEQLLQAGQTDAQPHLDAGELSASLPGELHLQLPSSVLPAFPMSLMLGGDRDHGLTGLGQEGMSLDKGPALEPALTSQDQHNVQPLQCMYPEFSGFLGLGQAQEQGQGRGQEQGQDSMVFAAVAAEDADDLSMGNLDFLDFQELSCMTPQCPLLSEQQPQEQQDPTCSGSSVMMLQELFQRQDGHDDN